MQVSSSRKSSGASCDIRDYEGARTTRDEELGKKRKGRGKKAEINENGRDQFARCGARPGVGLISRCFFFLSLLRSPTRHYLQFDCR